MKKLLSQIFLFISPLIILIIIPFFILYYSKENFNHIEKLLKSKEKYLIGYLYNERNYDYLKWYYLNTNDAKVVWALGSSRVLQFRERMFDSSFYNAGYTISGLRDFKLFLKTISDSKYPRYIIMGLDPWMFNPNHEDFTKIWVTTSKKKFYFFPNLLSTYQSVYKDLFSKKYTFTSLIEKDNQLTKVGLNAILNDTGFRNDGSMYYGIQIKKLIDKDTTAADFNYSSAFYRIEKGEKPVEYGAYFNEKTLLELNQFLEYCKLKHIQVIAFLTPYPDKVYEKMIESHKYGYMEKIYKKIKPCFDNHNYELYDFSKVSLCKSNDNEVIDGFHGGELTYQRILITILESGSVLNKVTNVKRLKVDLLNSKNNYIIYDN